MLVIFTLAFWQRTGWGLVRTALAAIVPFIPGLLQDPAGSWRQAASTVAVVVIAAIATSLNGLPDTANGNVFAVAFQRAVRQFGQYVVGGLVGALLLSDVDWRALLIAAAASALTTFVLAALTLLPSAAAALTPAPVVDGAAVITNVGTVNAPAAITAAPVLGLTDDERSALQEVRTVFAGNAINGAASPAVSAIDKALTAA